MFMKKGLVRKISMIIASLALIVPLASLNSTSVSAHRVHHHYRVVRVMKHHHKRHAKRIRKHVARKHARKHMRIGATTSYRDRVNVALNRAPKNLAYNRGFNDALNAKVDHQLAHNAAYEKGYLQIIALDNYTDPSGKQIPKHLSQGALQSAAAYYRYCVLK